jgi:hypothetical protein
MQISGINAGDIHKYYAKIRTARMSLKLVFAGLAVLVSEFRISYAPPARKFLIHYGLRISVFEGRYVILGAYILSTTSGLKLRASRKCE